VSLKFQASLQAYSSASHIENPDASSKGKYTDAMQATDAESQFWEAVILRPINFLPDNNYRLEETNNCKDVAMVSDARPLSIDIYNEKILIIDVDLGIK
jgi:hypothetical protein